jgi:addiction module HigA family antidote
MGRRLKNVHPGEVLGEEFLKPLGVSAYRMAKEIGVPATRVSEILHGRRSVTADTALRLAKYFGTSAKFWLGLQEDHDLEEESLAKAKELKAIVPLDQAG